MKRRAIECTLLAVSGAVVVGCATKPIPRYGKVDTFEIVRAVRCEARAAIQDLFKNGMSVRGGTDVAISGPALAETYSELGLALDFSFLANEANSNGGSVTAAGEWPVGTYKIKIGGNFDRSRKNTRTFIVSDNASKLSAGNVDYCADKGSGPNDVYPITGTIGLEESIRTFIELNERGDLRSRTDKVPAMVDKLEFSTTIGANTTPSFAAKAGIGHLHIVDITYVGMVSRTDTHTLQFALSMPTKASEKKGKSASSSKRKREEAARSAEDNAVKAIGDVEAQNFIRLLDDLKSIQTE